MVKDPKQLVIRSDLFRQNHDVKCVQRELGTIKILLDGEYITKKDLGHKAFIEIENNMPFTKKWATLITDLSNQIIADSYE